MTDPRDILADRLGIVGDYKDQTGAAHQLTSQTRDALLHAMGQPTERAEAARVLAELEADSDGLPQWVVLQADAPSGLAALDGQSWQIETESGEVLSGSGTDLPALSLGIHALTSEGAICWLLCAPQTLPEPAPSWGVTLPLYGLDPSGDIGTYGQLADAVRALGAVGADFVGINPIHAGFGDAVEISPYAPTHRGRFATQYLGDGGAGSGGDLIDYGAALPRRQAALRVAYHSDTDARFDAWRADQGADLQIFALHQALSESYGAYWTDWPQAFHDPHGPAAQTFAADHPDRLRFHAWAQYQAEQALAAVQEAADSANMRFGLYLDLAVGTHPSGAETWGAPDLFARNVSLGAPPDAFSADGQSWGIAPLRPDALARDGFRPLARILRQQLAHARLLRIDHILGFERAFWVPQDPDIPGAYVKMPKEAMLAIVRMEAARVGATIVGEDLGNIPDGLRADLETSGILGCRVAQFEQDWAAGDPTFTPASGYTRSALTSFGTHDLPSWKGWQKGRDVEWRRDLGAINADTYTKIRAHRLAEAAALTKLIGGSQANHLHAFLADAPSRLIAVQIEDILGRVEQPNLPGTIHDHPNWRRVLGVAPSKLGTLDDVRSVAKIMQAAGR